MMEYHWNGHSYDVTSYPNTLPKRKISVGDVLTTICISVFGLFLGGILCWGLHLDATYSMKGTISSIDTSAKEVFFIDETGNVFSYYSDLKNEYVGKHITAKFDHMGTESDRTDDHVINVR